jgi:ADP-ribosyl-[dinitrogen reductase] hydrolase
MLGAIAADIIGSRFEGELGPRRAFALFHPDCRFTDDSVCTLAIADALMGRRDFARSLRAFVRRHPNRGYGEMFLDWALADDAPAYGSWGNGAPMRVAAVGWLAHDESEALELAAAQAVVSHDHPHAVAASQAVALAILLARSGLPRVELARRLVNDFGYDLAPDRVLKPGDFDISAAGTVPQALAAALVADDWEGTVRTAVCLGGDTDTLACIAGAVAEAIHGLPVDIARVARSYLTDDLRAVLMRFEAAVQSAAR